MGAWGPAGVGGVQVGAWGPAGVCGGQVGAWALLVRPGRTEGQSNGALKHQPSTFQFPVFLFCWSTFQIKLELQI